MSAQVIPFPTRAIDAERLADVADRLKTAIPLPTSADLELDMLLQIGGKLLDNLNDYTRPDCSGLMDEWVERLDKWDAKTAL
ncbi:hypothetical protein [Sphingomonas paucimobilis]|uniref:hypothetical protein n=1 Tax=Sphingomonas paucimobilis TaxID=13689 RepID=UPI0031E33EBA